jgi:hypothetical protein
MAAKEETLGCKEVKDLFASISARSGFAFACQHGAVGASARQPSLAQVLAEVLTRRQRRRAEMLTRAA